jgi:tetratricopeptide (TPR) repeat protein
VRISDSVSLIGRLISSGTELHEKYPSNKVISDQHNDLEQLFVNPVDRPGLDYDPRRVLADFDIDSLDIGPELRNVLMHFGRLRYRVPGFPLESLARTPEDIRAEIPTADTDWLQIRLLDDRLSYARVTNQREEAADMMQRMLAINREQPELLISLATLELDRGNTAIAIPLLRDFVRIEPAIAEGYYLLGLALRNTDSDGALVAWRRAIELRPQWFRPLNDMAWLLATHPGAAFRKPAEAVRLAERAIQLSPGNPFLLDTLAAAYAATGDFSRAQQTVEEALRNLDQITVDIEEADLRSRLALYAARQPMIDPMR